ncbi:hypothetical protein DES52_107159 [Deinococcus yavapaiensis KR-236]|uniref:PRC-barrel domain protein n=1 Tax=Deinococcus yavapaiensis KR-236 TaxID=694435 RepID=A0A318SMW8_9DEIO|nr:hypothetical protein DES52_107159 [Deinococcus yavapaiensis KR-236]
MTSSRMDNLIERSHTSSWLGEGSSPWGLPAYLTMRMKVGVVHGGLFSTNQSTPRYLIVISPQGTRWLIPFPLARVERQSVHFDALHEDDLEEMTPPVGM